MSLLVVSRMLPRCRLGLLVVIRLERRVGRVVDGVVGRGWWLSGLWCVEERLNG